MTPDPSSQVGGSGDPGSPWPRRLLAAVTWLTGAWLVLVVDMFSQAGSNVLVEVGSEIGAWMLTIGWLALLMFSARARASHPLYRVGAPIGLLAGVLLGSMAQDPIHPLLESRFELSRPSLTREARQQLRAPRPSPRWVGLFPVSSVTVFEGQVRFITMNSGILYSCGFVYSPGGPPRRLYEDRFAPLGSGWYHVIEGI